MYLPRRAVPPPIAARVAAASCPSKANPERFGAPRSSSSWEDEESSRLCWSETCLGKELLLKVKLCS
jgi:hypothetical protein